MSNAFFAKIKIGPAYKQYRQEVRQLQGFVHRLRNTQTGEFTRWATYTEIAVLDDMVGHTAYYGPKENVLPAAEFCKLIGAGKAE